MKGRVTGHYVAIRPDEVTASNKLYSSAKQAGLYIPENELKREQAATTTGTVISVGPQAFKAFGPNHDGPRWADIGHRVVFVKHVSKVVDDEDNFDEEGNPKKVFVLTDENIIWNFDAETVEDEK